MSFDGKRDTQATTFRFCEMEVKLEFGEMGRHRLIMKGRFFKFFKLPICEGIYVYCECLHLYGLETADETS